MRIYRNLKVWSMYADLEESLGTFEVSPAHTSLEPTAYSHLWFVSVSLFVEHQGSV